MMTRAAERRQASSAVIGVVGLAMIGGCGGPFDAKLSGTVTLDGAALPSGKMMFTPMDAEGTTAYAGIDSSGRYRVQTGSAFGIKPGEYSVTVVARSKPDASKVVEGGPPQLGELLTPRWYGRPATSGITVNVEPGSNSRDLELTTTPPDGWQEVQANRSGRQRRS
ncbi:MAG: hypothetical protein AAFV43_01245 [Planctomycetota bacterium]